MKDLFHDEVRAVLGRMQLLIQRHTPPVKALPYTPWSKEEDARLEKLYAKHPVAVVARLMKRTIGSISGRSRVLNLHRDPGGGWALRAAHRAVVEGTTIFPLKVVPVEISSQILKSGFNSRKLGKVVEKGKWRGMPIFSLTLEERATCPRSCLQWRNCYGNNMNLATRYQPGVDLALQLNAELKQLQRKHPHGFVVRLHVLGDFYSLLYVRCWEALMREYKALHVFGYTAHQPGTPIGDAVGALRGVYSGRWAMRHSGALSGYRTVVLDQIMGQPHPKTDAIICPAQTGRTRSCGTCALCWSTDRTIAFLRH